MEIFWIGAGFGMAIFLIYAGLALLTWAEKKRRGIMNQPTRIDEILLKPAHWQYDDYQRAKQAILADLLAMPELQGHEAPALRRSELGEQEYWRQITRNLAINDIRQALTAYFEGVER